MTLLEVMVAMMILAMTGYAALSLSSHQTRHLSGLEKSVFAQLVAGNLMTKIHMNAIWPDDHPFRGTTIMADTTWYWSWQGMPTSDGDVRMIEVSVGLSPEAPPLTTLRALRMRDAQP